MKYGITTLALISVIFINEILIHKESNPWIHSKRPDAVALFCCVIPVDKLLSEAQKYLMTKFHISCFYMGSLLHFGTNWFHIVSDISHFLAMIWNKKKNIEVSCYI